MADVLASLDAAIEKHLRWLIVKRNWRPVSVCEYENSYAQRRYSSGDIAIQAANQRGLMELEIGSVHAWDSLRSASSIRDLLDPPRAGQWNLGFGIGPFLDQRWDEIAGLLSSTEWQTTIRRIDERYRRLHGHQAS